MRQKPGFHQIRNPNILKIEAYGAMLAILKVEAMDTRAAIGLLA